MTRGLDLLQKDSAHRIQLDGLDQALPFAFAAGDTAGVFEKALRNAKAPQTSLDSDCFAHDLFLDDLLCECLRGTPKGSSSKPCVPYLRRLLSSPPVSRETALYRQRVFKELEDPQTRRAFEELYVQVRLLRDWLDGQGLTIRQDMLQRRLDILRTLRDVFRSMADGFESCQSALGKLSCHGREVRAQTAYQQLEELLTYEQHLATLDLRIQVGIDGRIREFQVLDVAENDGNGFHSHWLVRLWTKFRLLLRGYPMQDQELLVRLTDAVFETLKPALLPLFQLVGDMEFYLAGLSLMDRAAARGLTTCYPTFRQQGQGGGVSIDGLFNPFLLGQDQRVVTCGVKTQSPYAMTIVTGPNSGGKTRLLQAVALTQLLGQCGLPVPASSAELEWGRGLFVSIVSEVSANQPEGRLGMELLRIRKLFEQMRPGTVVMLDELCSGTNPSEGEEIFQLVMELLSELKPQLWLTTHFLSLAGDLAKNQPFKNLEFLQVELNEEQLPTYQFRPGVAETSLAGKIASRLGVTRAELTGLVAQAKQR